MLKFVREFRLVLMFLSPVEDIMSSRMHSHFLHLLFLLIYLIGINSSVCINQTVCCVFVTYYIRMVVLKDCEPKLLNILSVF